MLYQNRNICAAQQLLYSSLFALHFVLILLALHGFAYFAIHSEFAGQCLEFYPGKVGVCFSVSAQFHFASTPGRQLYPHCGGILLPFARLWRASQLLPSENQLAAPKKEISRYIMITSKVLTPFQGNSEPHGGGTEIQDLYQKHTFSLCVNCTGVTI